MITLTLLHPIQATPVQTWPFDDKSVIRIGRSTDNEVVLYSAVVSRHHVEIRRTDSHWEVVNLGTNGTYIDGKRINRVPVADGLVIRLARSGPNIQIHLGQPDAAKILNRAAAARSNPSLIPPHGSDEGVTTRTNEDIYAPPLPPDGTRTDEARHSITFDTDPTTPLADAPSVVEPSSQIQPTTQYTPAPHTPVPQATLPQTTFNDVDVANGSSKRYVPSGCLTPADCAQRSPQSNGPFCLACGYPLEVKQVLGEYQVLKTLGYGGMGITYLVWRDRQTLVLKTLNSEWIHNAKAQELFEREASVLRQLEHPGIPKFTDFFSLNDQPYLVMEMIYGQDLGHRIAERGPAPPQQAIRWMLELCDILSYLHKQNPPLLHRDIKPNNLICRSVARNQREIVLVDFGAVKVLAQQAGTHIGSEGYAAPEQQEGHPTPLSDLYSMGATLVYLLTGEEPNQFYGFKQNHFRLLVEAIPNLNPAIGEIIWTLTHPEPELRYHSADDVAIALRQLI